MSNTFDPYRRWLGILPEEQPPNHYRLLGLSLFESDPEVIEQAADRQISHVQRHKQGEFVARCNALLQELVGARLCLLQPATKAAYDQRLRASLAATSAASQSSGSSGIGSSAGAPPVTAPPQTPARPVPIAVQPAAVTPMTEIAEADQSLSSSARRSKRAKRASNSNSLVVTGFVIAALVCVGIIGWAVMNASSSKPPAAAPVAETAKHKPAAHEPAPAAAKHVETATTESAVDSDDGAPADSSIVDLLALIQPERDTVAGKWRKLRGKLAMLDDASDTHARLQIPYHPPEEYQLDLTVTRKKGAEVDVGLALAGRQVTAITDGWGGETSALNMVDGQPGSEGPTAHHGQVITPGVVTHLSAVVKRNGITVSCNGQPVVTWSGDPAALEVSEMFSVPDRQSLYLAGYKKGFIVSRLQLTPITGAGEAVVPSTGAVASLPKPAPPRGRTPVVASDPSMDEPAEEPSEAPIQPKAFQVGQGNGPQTAPAEFKPRPALPRAGNLAEVPDEAARQETLKLLRDVYADAYKQAKKPADKLALAERLLGEAAKSENPVEQFVLYSEARSQAVAGESPALVVQAVQQLGARFKVPVDEAIVESLEQMNQETLPAPVRKEMAECLLPIADHEVEAENYALARRLLVLALACAKKTNDKQLVKDVTTRGNEVTDLRRSAEALTAAQKVLDERPDDAEANLAKGKYLALNKNDWPGGLPHLAKGSDAGLADVAKLELAQLQGAGGNSADDHAKIGDAWWALAEDAKGRERAQYQARAGHWYGTALPLLKGLAQTKVSKRLDELAAATSKAKPAASSAKPAPSAGKVDKLAGLPALKDLPQRIRMATKKEMLIRSRLGGSGTGLAYLDVSQAGLLVGFNYTVVERFNWSYIASIQPIYQTLRGVDTGQIYGIPLGDVHTVLAKKGYAVAGVNGALQSYIYGMEVIFNAVDGSGNLNPSDSYRSDWLGAGQSYYQMSVGDNGLQVIGIYGTGGDYLTGLGVVQLPKP